MTVWFAAAWHVTSGKNGVAAVTLHRLLGFGSYQTAWTMLHRFRTAMVRPGRDRLRGVVEVDETYVGSPRKGKRGRGAEGKTLVAVAVELKAPKGFGRCRLQVIPNAGAKSLGVFLRECVEPGSVVVTDGFVSYPAAIGNNYVHRPVDGNASGQEDRGLLPGVHWVASLTKRWLMGTHQGAVREDHLQAYLDEFSFRFNRRKSEFRGLLFRRLLEQSVQVEPVSYRLLVANPAPTGEQSSSSGGGPARAQSIDEGPAPGSRPWRRHKM